MEVVVDAALEAELRRALEAVHGERRTRLLTVEEVKGCVRAAAASPLGYAWRHGGATGDPRAWTTVCLCVARQDGVAIGLAPARAQDPDPARAWRSLPAWDRYDDAANAARMAAWAAPLSLVAPWQRPAPDDDSALREAISRALDDDAPRLVYADWLSERGDPRGELIALQCAGASAEALLAEHGEGWARGLDVRFERGFASAVSVRASEDLERLATFAPREFVTRLTVAGAINVHALAAAPWLQAVRTLELRATRGRLDLPGLRALLRSRFLGGLHTLTCSGQRLGDEGLALLAQEGGHRLPAVRHLRVEEDTVGPAGVARLVEARWFAQLESLSLSGNPLGPSGVAALTRSPRPTRLVALSVDRVRAGDQGLRALLDATCFPSLRSLSMARNRLTPRGEQALREAGHAAPRP